MIESQEIAKSRLQEFGVKLSFQRIAIMDFLLKNPIHPTVDVIFSNLYPSIPTLSKTTVYNTLKLFEEHKVIHPILIDEKNVRYDANIIPHAHFKCKNCQQIMDIPIGHVNDLINKSEHDIIDCHIYYYGYCEKCRK